MIDLHPNRQTCLQLKATKHEHMATPIEKITQEVIELSRRERLTLMRLLLDLDQPSKGDKIEKAWDQEIRARVKAVDEGRVSGVRYDEIKREMNGRFGSR